MRFTSVIPDNIAGEKVVCIIDISGEASVVGNQDTYSMWGHIKGPGPEDVVIFSTDNMLLRMENEISPQVAVPTISMVSNDGGVTPIAPDSLIRTQKTLTIIGSGLGGGTAIEIMSGDLEVQKLFLTLM